VAGRVQKDVGVVVVVRVDSTLRAAGAGAVPSVDDAEVAVELVHNTHTEEEEEHTSFQNNHT